MSERIVGSFFCFFGTRYFLQLSCPIFSSRQSIFGPKRFDSSDLNQASSCLDICHVQKLQAWKKWICDRNELNFARNMLHCSVTLKRRMEFFFGKTCDADSRDAAPFVDRTTSRFESCESLCGLIVCVRETYSISESEKIWHSVVQHCLSE